MFKIVSDSQKPSLALVYPADSFAAKDLCQQLLRRGCQVIAVCQHFVENLLPLVDQPAFIFHYWDDWQKLSSKKVDYIFEIGPSGELLSLAKKHRAKYLSVLTNYQSSLLPRAKKMKIDSREAIGHQLFGPTLNFSQDDFLNRNLAEGIKGGTLLIPGNGLMRVYPLAVEDFAAGAIRAMLRPGTRDKTFHFYGEPITVFSLAHLIKAATKGQVAVKSVIEGQAGSIDKPLVGLLKQLKQELDWRPRQDLAKAIKRTVWQKQEEIADVKGTGKVKTLEAIEAVQEPKIVGESGKLLSGTAGEEERIETEEAGEGVLPPLNLTAKQAKLKAIFEASQRTVDNQEALATPTAVETVKVPPEPPVASQEKKIRKNRRALKCFLVFLVLITFVFVFPWLGIGFQAYQGWIELQKAQGAIQAGKLKEFGAYCERARTKFTLAKEGLERISPFLALVKLENLSLVVDFWLSLGQQLAHTGVVAQHLGQNAVIFNGELLASDKVDVKGFIDKEEKLLDELILSIAELENKTNNDYLEIDIPFLKTQLLVVQLKRDLPKIKNLATTTKEALPIVSSLLAIEGRKTYLILLQNNMELRPTGGFIGSFGLATFEKGRFLDFGVMDVYAADGQLKGHVEPPAKLREYLGEGGWYLRDANWDPDFPTSAQKITWFLEKELGRTVDGVVAINLNFAKELLEATDGVFLSDYQEKITAANLFERAEYHAEIGFFPGSTQKSDFLASLIKTLLERAKTGDEKNFLGLARAVYHSLSGQDILVYLTDKQVFKLIQQLNWSGELTHPQCLVSQSPCYVDYSMLVEANLGVNKANYFVTRKVEQEIKLIPGRQVNRLLKIIYDNTAQSETWPAGRYKNYLRVYTPAGTELDECQIFRQDEQKGIDCQIDEELEHGKKVFGTLVEVPVGERRILVLRSKLAEKFPDEEKVSYLFFEQKQSGLVGTTNALLFSFPTELKPLIISPAGAYSPGSLLFTNNLERSRTYRAEFVK